MLFNVAKAYSNYDTGVGYCQGSPFIIAVLLMHMPEEESFSIFCAIMRHYGLRGLFKSSMADLPLRLYQLDNLLLFTFPVLHAHFRDIGLEIATYSPPMFLSMFATLLPLKLVCRVMDAFLLDGQTAIFRFALAIMADNHDRLLLANMEDAMLAMRTFMDYYDNSDNENRLVSLLPRIQVAPKRLQQLEKDFHAARSKEERDKNESNALKTENSRLDAENKALKEKVSYY